MVYSHAFRFVPGSEAVAGPERLQIGVLHQFLGDIGRPGEADRRAVERVQIFERFSA